MAAPYFQLSSAGTEYQSCNQRVPYFLGTRTAYSQRQQYRRAASKCPYLLPGRITVLLHFETCRQ